MSSRSPLGLILLNRRLDRRWDPSRCRKLSSPSLPLSTCNAALRPSSEPQLRWTVLPKPSGLHAQLTVWASLCEHGSERLRISGPDLTVTPTSFRFINSSSAVKEFCFVESKSWVLRYELSWIVLPSVSSCSVWVTAPGSSAGSWLNIQFFQIIESRCQRRTLIPTRGRNQNKA